MILPNSVLDAAEDNDRLWETMDEQRIKYNNFSEMWGFMNG